MNRIKACASTQWADPIGTNSSVRLAPPQVCWNNGQASNAYYNLQAALTSKNFNNKHFIQKHHKLQWRIW